MLTLYEENGIWKVKGYVAGERVRKSLKTRDRGQAEELKALIEAEIFKRRTYGEQAVKTFEDAADSYLDARGESRFVVPVALHFAGRLVSSIKPGEIHDAARAIYPNAGPGTWNRQVIVPARAVINHAHERGWCPPMKVKAFPTPKARRVAVDRSWLDAFLAQADADGLPHLAAAMLFMHQTGARISEAANVMPNDVDLPRRKITLAKTKTETFAERDITEELAARIQNLEPNPHTPLFGYNDRWGIYRRAKAVCRRAGIPWVPPHQAGRHSFATNALEYGQGIKETMDAGGWKSVELFMGIYVHSKDAGKRVAAAFDKNRSARKGPDLQVVGKKGKK